MFLPCQWPKKRVSSNGQCPSTAPSQGPVRTCTGGVIFGRRRRTRLILTVKWRRQRAVLGEQPPAASLQITLPRLLLRLMDGLRSHLISPMKTEARRRARYSFLPCLHLKAPSRFTVLVLSHRDSVMSELITTLTHGGISPLQRSRAQISQDSFSSAALKRSHR